MSLDVRHGKSRVAGRYSAVEIHMFVVMMERAVARGRSGGHDLNPGHGVAAVSRVDMPVLRVASRKTVRRRRWVGNSTGYEVDGDDQEKRV